ncbi:hypothetical protein NMY22_g7542 [Coprinellus aureogranulatus]|nr:hypothetical protein NMY22_g7542 [Coprinellus aureogranulatus]
MSFAFVPRALTKRKATHDAAAVKVNALSAPVPTTSQPTASSKGKEKASEGPSAEECAILFRLALSEYALWKDSDLRMKLDEGDGYVSLHHLLYHCQVLAPLRKVHQTLLVKHLKTHLGDVLDFRILVTEPKPWFSTSQPAVAGGYEVRLKTPLSSTLSKVEWEKRMVYVENVPIHYRTVAALVQFLLALLPTQDERTPFSRIQNVYLPPHHQDKPGDPPTFKGFAVVTFLYESDARHILESWPWHPDAIESQPGRSTDGARSDSSIDARKFGFRTTSKARWEELRAEYLLYRQQLVDGINAFQDSSAPAVQSSSRLTYNTVTSRDQSGNEDAPCKVQQTPAITLSSPYPYGCLLFIKNIHPETNKTTLKSLFGNLLSGTNGGIDYVDFNKGMDTCYLRLSTPSSAQALSSHLTSNPIIQISGLDDTGSPSSTSMSDLAKNASKPIAVEVVLGTREQMYWEKVPEKVRRSAVEKAVQLKSGNGPGERNKKAGDGGGQEDVGTDGKRPRKRRKR